MKFRDLDGQIHGIDITPFKRARANKSAGAVTLRSKIEEMFPLFEILEEFPCVGTRLRLDFFLPRLMLAFEFDGHQHEEFVPHFHRTRHGFSKSQDNDNDKELWCDINSIRLIRVTVEDLDDVESLL